MLFVKEGLSKKIKNKMTLAVGCDKIEESQSSQGGILCAR